jgi:hypothetical protein
MLIGEAAFGYPLAELKPIFDVGLRHHGVALPGDVGLQQVERILRHGASFAG